MILNFKIDNKNRLWFLFCSSLRIEGTHYSIKQPRKYSYTNKETLINAIPLKVEHKPHLTTKIRMGYSVSSKKPLNLHRNS